MNLLEKFVVGLGNAIISANNRIEKKYGVDVIKKVGERAIQEEEWEKKHPYGRIAKHLTVGTLRGVGGPVVGVIGGAIIDKTKKP